MSAIFDGDNVPQRRGTNSVKWDTAEARFGHPDLLPMWVADMDFPSPPCVIEAMRSAADFGVFAYYSPPCSYGRSFIDWERRRHGAEISEQWLRFTPGIVSAVFWCVQMLTKPGDGCILLTPVYYPLMAAVTENKRALVTSELINENGSYAIDFDDFENKIVLNGVKLFILCSPHNPIARVWRREELRRLTDICVRHGVYIVSDEIHQDITFAPRHCSALLLPECREKLIVLTSASKTFNIAGLQNSFAIIPDGGLRALFDDYAAKIHMSKGSSPGYIAAEAAFKKGGPWIEEVLLYIAENERVLRHILTEACPEIVISPMEGTYMCWVDLGAYISAADIAQVVLHDARLAVDFGNWFWPAGKQSDTHIRINVATSRNNVIMAARQLTGAINTHISHARLKTACPVI